jgi:para-nitrobenzyl esterase
MLAMNRREVLVGGVAVGVVAATRSGFGSQVQPAPVAKTIAGKISGYDAGMGIAAFKGIPYGLDTAQTRFAAPKKPVGWSDVRVCTEWGPRAPQTVGARPEF